MGRQVCSYCGGSGRDMVTPEKSSCWKCGGTGTEWVQDPIKSETPRAPRRRPAGQYRPLPFMQNVLDGIPRWLNAIVAVVGGALGIAAGQAMDPSAGAAAWLLGAGGALVGFMALPLTVLLLDLSVQVTLVLVKLALVLAVVGGVIYGLSQLLR